MFEMKFAPRLRALPDLGHYELHAGSLTEAHIGRTVAVATDSAVIAGPLVSLAESRSDGRGRLILSIETHSTIGVLVLGLHPAHPVTILPADYALSVVARAPGVGDE